MRRKKQKASLDYLKEITRDKNGNTLLDLDGYKNALDSEINALDSELRGGQAVKSKFTSEKGIKAVVSLPGEVPGVAYYVHKDGTRTTEEVKDYYVHGDGTVGNTSKTMYKQHDGTFTDTPKIPTPETARQIHVEKSLRIYAKNNAKTMYNKEHGIEDGGKDKGGEKRKKRRR